MASSASGEPRRTSNGCKVFQRIARKETGFRIPSGNVAAIDFGTTNCSLAYITVTEQADDVPKMLRLNNTFYRVATAILFCPDGTIDSFGFEARSQYQNIEDHERLQYAFFEQIKMDLQHDEGVSREKIIKANNGKEYYLVDVIAQILKYLKNKFIESLQKGGHALDVTDFDWVITVPAIWTAKGKQMMREAGYKAGLCSEETCGKLQPASRGAPSKPVESSPEKLSLALEPESASIFCQNMSQKNDQKYCPTASRHSADSCHLVVDIGGGTVDISAHRITSSANQNIEVVHRPMGNDCGGSRVNREFGVFLEGLVNNPGLSKYVTTADEETNAKHKADLITLLNDSFEKQKTIFGNREPPAAGDNPKYSVRLPFTFMVTYDGELKKGLRQYDKSEVELRGQDLRIAHRKMVELFKPIIDGILECLGETLASVEVKVEAIYLVGGFGGCRYIQTVISDRFGGDYRYVIPAEPHYSVVRGAVIFRRNPELVHARTVDATYGVNVQRPFDPSKHNEEYCFVKNGVRLCSSLFATVVECGETVSTDEVFIRVYRLSSKTHPEDRVTISIYKSPEKDVWYTTGKREKSSRIQKPVPCSKVGQFELDAPNWGGGVQREVEVTFDFSHTEIQAKGYDKASQNEVIAVLDFL